MSAHTEQWCIVVRAEGDGPPLEIRVRHFLKRALRGYGLRCVRVDAVAGNGPGVAPAASGGRQGAGGPDAERRGSA